MSDIIWTSTAAVSATGGRSGPWNATSLSIDTRSMEPGALFIALKGEKVDGHTYAQEAIQKGAVAVMVDRPLEHIPETKQLIVADTFAALNKLATFRRASARAQVVAVTGSVGKTSMKEMLKVMFSAFGRVYANYGNFNNHIGAPLSMAGMPSNTDYGVFELGMNHAGELAALTRIIKPNVALITTVEAVHLEFFKSVEKIADAKSEIFEGLVIGGAAIINADNAWANHCMARAKKLGINRILTVGKVEHATIQLMSAETVSQGTEVIARIEGHELRYSLSVIGQHWAQISAMALAVAMALKLDMQKAARSLTGFTEPEGRGRVSIISVKGGEALLVDDSYNASPASMRAAFDRVRLLARQTPHVKRRIAVLGDMLELGAQAETLHVELAKPLQVAGFDRVYTAGKISESLQNQLPRGIRAGHADEAEELLPVLQEELQPDDIVLLKGSHGSRMYHLAELLKKTT